MNTSRPSTQDRSGANGYSRGPGIFSLLTAWVTRARREGKTLATHQFKFRTPETIVHATRRGVIEQPWAEYQTWMIDHGYEYAITERVQPPTIDEVQVVQSELSLMIGWKFSSLELLLQAIDGLTSKLLSRDKMGLDVVVFRRLGDLWEQGVICSKTGNRVDIKLLWKPPILEYGSPDDSWDYDASCGSGWAVVFHTPKWYR